MDKTKKKLRSFWRLIYRWIFFRCIRNGLDVIVYFLVIPFTVLLTDSLHSNGRLCVCVRMIPMALISPSITFFGFVLFFFLSSQNVDGCQNKLRNISLWFRCVDTHIRFWLSNYNFYSVSNIESNCLCAIIIHQLLSYRNLFWDQVMVI